MRNPRPGDVVQMKDDPDTRYLVWLVLEDGTVQLAKSELPQSPVLVLVPGAFDPAVLYALNWSGQVITEGPSA